MTIFLLAFVFVAIVAYEAPGLVRKKLWRELAAFTVLLVIGMVLSFGQALKLSLPNPARGIDALFGPMTRYLEKLLA
jgi:hypothetical protein